VVITIARHPTDRQWFGYCLRRRTDSAGARFADGLIFDGLRGPGTEPSKRGMQPDGVASEGEQPMRVWNTASRIGLSY
jgi:hypothetical protein